MDNRIEQFSVKISGTLLPHDSTRLIRPSAPFLVLATDSSRRELFAIDQFHH